MERITKWIGKDIFKAHTLCMAGERFFCRLQFQVMWDVPKDWPLDYHKYCPGEAIGYSSISYDEAIRNAFEQLPTGEKK